MTLKRLLIQNFRNLESVDIYPSDGVNLLCGENGSGKTSVLEAINVLSLGRSFRSHKHKSLIKQGQTALTVFGKLLSDEGAEVPVGIKRNSDGTSSFKVSGNQVQSAAALAVYLPVQVINSDTFSLLEGSPIVRRQFLDWLVFHVEPKFFTAWRDCQRCLKHRNSLLRRDRIDLVELSTWDGELIQLSEQIDKYRQSCFDQFKMVFEELIREFVSVDGISIGYACGWDRERTYREVLESAYERDHGLGYTHSGIHRADLRITVNSQNAAEILSRGQQKLLVCALKIAQGLTFSKLCQRKTIYLVDDLPAELDEKHRFLLAHWLDVMNTQVFVTGVEREMLVSVWQDRPNAEIKMFHVEQGRINAERN